MKKTTVSRFLSAGLAVLALGMAGCATRDTVSSRFPQVEEKISAAKTAGAELYAPDPLRSAEAKLEAAKSAVRGNDMVAAASLVDQAMVDADYAQAKAPTEKAKNEAVQLRAAILALRADIQSMPVAK